MRLQVEISDLGLSSAAFNRLFMTARALGLVTHVLEEQTREEPTHRGRRC